MPLVDNAWYVNYGDGSTTGYYAITKWATATVYAAGAIRRQKTAPAVGSERVFVCIVGGTSHAVTEPTWGITRGAKTTDNTVTWQEVSGQAALNGDATSTLSWTQLKNTAIVLGQVIKRDNGASYQICTTAGTAGNGSEPAFSDTAGTTTTDNTVTWTSLGVVGNFTGWQAPHARIANALAANWGGVGDVFYVGDNHAETQATGNNIVGPLGSNADPIYIYCVSVTGSLPPVGADMRTTATVTTTSAVGMFIGNGSAWIEGISFLHGSLSWFNIGDSSTSVRLALKNCVVRRTSTGSINIGIAAGNVHGLFRFINTSLGLNTTGDRIVLGLGDFIWEHTSTGVVGGTIATYLFGGNSSAAVAYAGNHHVMGVDLSMLGSGKTLVGPQVGRVFTFTNCKLHDSVTVLERPSAPGATVYIVDCGSTGAVRRNEKHDFGGYQIIETTVVRTGGAAEGATPIAWKIVSSADVEAWYPYTSIPMAIWNDVTGASVTLTVYGVWGGGAVPDNDEIWLDVSYMGSAASPVASVATSGLAASLTAATALDSDSSTWGGSTTKFKMSVTFTPELAGVLYACVRIARASSTFYIDPKIELS